MRSNLRCINDPAKHSTDILGAKLVDDSARKETFGESDASLKNTGLKVSAPLLIHTAKHQNKFP